MGNIRTGQQRDQYRDHAQVWELLPWHINGSLSAEEKQQISEHIAVCLICRKELGLQSALRDSVRNYELDELMVSASFDRLSAKLRLQDAGIRSLAQDSRSNLRQRAGKFAGALKLWMQQCKSGYFVTAMSVLAIVVILPEFVAELLPGNNAFRTLSDRLTEAPAADLRLIFAEDVSESERGAILNGAGLSIVSGPDERGLYFVNADNASTGALQATLEQLRGDEKILFAEFAISAAANSPSPEGR